MARSMVGFLSAVPHRVEDPFCCKPWLELLQTPGSRHGQANLWHYNSVVDACAEDVFSLFVCVLREAIDTWLEGCTIDP